MIRLISASKSVSGCGRRPRREHDASTATAARLERATPSVSATVFMAYLPDRMRVRATAFFWLRQIQRLAQDLVLHGLLAEQPLQLTHLLLQGPVLGGRHHLVAGADRRERALGIKPPPSEQLVRPRSRAAAPPVTPTSPARKSPGPSAPSPPLPT